MTKMVKIDQKFYIFVFDQEWSPMITNGFFNVPQRKIDLRVRKSSQVNLRRRKLTYEDLHSNRKLTCEDLYSKIFGFRFRFHLWYLKAVRLSITPKPIIKIVLESVKCLFDC